MSRPFFVRYVGSERAGIEHRAGPIGNRHGVGLLRHVERFREKSRELHCVDEIGCFSSLPTDNGMRAVPVPGAVEFDHDLHRHPFGQHEFRDCPCHEVHWRLRQP